MVMRLNNEFATVEIERDDSGNGPRLKIRDARSGRAVMLDPLELSALAAIRHDELAPFLDPSRCDRPRASAKSARNGGAGSNGAR